MKISKVEFWNSPMLWTIVLKTISKISRHVENHVKNFKACWNIVFKMHYRFQHVLKFSFQHALQISTCAEIFKMPFKMFSTHFKHKNSPMVWTMLKTVENHVKYFKVCWKPCWKFQGMLKTMSKISKCVKNHHDMTAMWPFPSILKHNRVIKIKSDIINEDYRSLWCYMWSVIEILCGLEEKIGPACMQLLHNVHATENFQIQPCCELLFLSNWVNLLSIFTSCEKLRAFKRNPCLGTDIWCLGDE